MRTLFVTLPCYNESQNIQPLIEKWLRQQQELTQSGYTLHVAPIDDCSTDTTKEILQSVAAEHEQVMPILHEKNLGLCGGINTAIAYFLRHGSKGDLLALMDGDNTQDPCYIHAMLSKLDAGKDCVIASRYRAESGVVGLAKHRAFMSDMAKHYYRLVLRVPNVRDYTCGYRVYTYDCIDRLVSVFGQTPVQERSFACMMELLYKAYIAGAEFVEIGFQLRYDHKKGDSKMRVSQTMWKSLLIAPRLRLTKKRIGSERDGLVFRR